jgi:hypothetical protein
LYREARLTPSTTAKFQQRRNPLIYVNFSVDRFNLCSNTAMFKKGDLMKMEKSDIF